MAVFGLERPVSPSGETEVGIGQLTRISHRVLLNGCNWLDNKELCDSSEYRAYCGGCSAETSKRQAREAVLSLRSVVRHPGYTPFGASALPTAWRRSIATEGARARGGGCCCPTIGSRASSMISCQCHLGRSLRSTTKILLDPSFSSSRRSAYSRRVSILGKRIRRIRISPNLPITESILLHEVDPSDKLGSLPTVELRYDDAGRAAVFEG